MTTRPAAGRRVFTARYPGRCGECAEDLQGTEVVYGPDNRLIHLDCLDPALLAAATAARRQAADLAVCDTCHLTKPCGCDDP